jgi:hypothetical protein
MVSYQCFECQEVLSDYESFRDHMKYEMNAKKFEIFKLKKEYESKLETRMNFVEFIQAELANIKTDFEIVKKRSEDELQKEKLKFFNACLSFPSKKEDFKSSLNELDFLTELFSFIDIFDQTVCRQVCRWWNDLLTKDTLICNQINSNEDSMVKDSDSMMVSSADQGYFELVKWLRKNGRKWDEYVCSYATKPSSFKILKWFRDTKIHGTNICPWDSTTSLITAGDGSVAMLKWLRKNDCEWDSDGWRVAANKGNLKVLKWLHGEKIYFSWNSNLQESQSKNLESLSDDEEESVNRIWNSRLCNWAALEGQLDVLIWLRDKTVHGGGICPLDTETCSGAARSGNLDLMKWLRDKNIHGENGICPWNEYTSNIAALHGNLNILQYVRDKSIHGVDVCPWSIETCLNAVVWDHLDVLKWLRDKTIHGSDVCPWNSKVSWDSARFGHLDILKWSLENGCEFDPKLFDYSKFESDIKEYLVSFLKSKFVR